MEGEPISSQSIDNARAKHIARNIVSWSPALAFTGFLTSNGLPSLRQDWAWIPDRQDLVAGTIASLVWLPAGIGHPRPYPEDYLLAISNAALVMVAGIHVGFVLFLLAVGLACVFGARRLVAGIQNDQRCLFGASLIAVFNPWVYVEVVAGHLAMIFAYGALMALAGAALDRRSNRYVIALFVVGTTVQLQMFLVAAIIVCFISIRSRDPLPAAAALIAVSPDIVGILGHSKAVLAIPYNIDWQRNQSLSVGDAFLLRGYFAHYTADWPLFSWFAVGCVALLACCGTVSGYRRGATWIFFVSGSMAALWATGLRGPLASTYRFVVAAFPAAEIYRELYDLVGIVVIAYVGLAAIFAKRIPLTSIVQVLLGLALFVTWIELTPARYWVPLRALPAIDAKAAENSRIAFYPDIQPLSFYGRGSGLDPDAFTRRGGITTLNDPDEIYPAEVALQRYASTGDASLLAALGVSRIVARPWLLSQANSYASQSALPRSGVTASNVRGSISIRPMSELTESGALPQTTLPPSIADPEVFYADAIEPDGTFEPIRPSAEHLRASSGWVDARLAFVARPALAQGLGGVITSTNAEPLHLNPNLDILAWIDGSLIADGRVLVAHSHGMYAWYKNGASRVRCLGVCLVVGQGVPPHIPRKVSVERSEPLAFHMLAPWLLTVEIGATETRRTIRLAEAYDANWDAFESAAMLPHFRVNAMFNGWIVMPSPKSRGVLLVEHIAALQQICEIVALLFVAFVGFKGYRSSFYGT